MGNRRSGDRAIGCVLVIPAPVAARVVSRSNRGRRLVPREASRSEADVLIVPVVRAARNAVFRGGVVDGQRGLNAVAQAEELVGHCPAAVEVFALELELRQDTTGAVEPLFRA